MWKMLLWLGRGSMARSGERRGRRVDFVTARRPLTAPPFEVFSWGEVCEGERSEVYLKTFGVHKR
jgi:hypothetical protein